MWMIRDVVTINPEQSITAAAMLMAQRHVRRLAVVQLRDDAERLIGVVTRSNVYSAFPPGLNPFSPAIFDQEESKVLVQDIMRFDPLTTTPDTAIEVAARVMADNKVGCLPVIRSERLVGMITESDIFRAFVEFFDSAAGEVRISFYALPREDLLAIVLPAAQKTGTRLLGMFSTQHAGQTLCVVRVTVENVDAFVDHLCQGHHPPINVLRT